MSDGPRLFYKRKCQIFGCSLPVLFHLQPDIIGYEKEYLVFFEVKYRKNDFRGNAAEAVGFGKQRKICRVSDYYRMIHGCPSDTPVRFDVIAIDGGRIEWIRNALIRRYPYSPSDE